jgi:HD-GYP domain-containing protein (c-di-GMP phosphodiesterase class II)
LRWVSLRSIQPDRVLAQHILDERGRILLAKGMKLSPGIIERLRRMGIGSVCIEDALTDDLKGREFIEPGTRQAMLEATYHALNEMTSANYSRVVRGPRLRQKLQPLILEVIAQLRSLGGSGEHFGTVYLSDGELYHHSVNVALFALGVAIGMGLTESQMIDLGVGALLHDIGKLRIPESILKKPGRLSVEEFEHMKLHTSYGYEILKSSGDLSSATSLVALEHHERVDGTGYPRGLQQGEIHLFGRIIGLVDVYEALTANRVYRPANLPHHALEFLLGGGGTQFDPTVVHAFVKSISVYPVGMTLVLSSGHKAVVINSPQFQTQRPVVRIIEESTGTPVKSPWEVDLSRDLTTQIVGCES